MVNNLHKMNNCNASSTLVMIVGTYELINLGRVSVTVRSNVTALNTTPLDQRERERKVFIYTHRHSKNSIIKLIQEMQLDI